MATRTAAGSELLDAAITFAETAAALTGLLAAAAGCREDAPLTAVPPQPGPAQGDGGRARPGPVR